MKKFDIDWEFHFNATLAMLCPLVLLKTMNKQFAGEHPIWDAVIYVGVFYLFPKYLRSALDQSKATWKA